MPWRPVAAQREPLPQVEVRPVAVDLQTAMVGQGERASVEPQCAAIELRLAVAVAKCQARVGGT
jgi:hypothetical protein